MKNIFSTFVDKAITLVAALISIVVIVIALMILGAVNTASAEGQGLVEMIENYLEDGNQSTNKYSREVFQEQLGGVIKRPNWLTIIIVGIPALLILGLVWFYVLAYKPQMLQYLRLGEPVKDKRNTHGSADWLSDEEIRKNVSKNVLTYNPDIVLGSTINVNDTRSKELKQSDIIKIGDYNRFNKHILVYSPSGGGKSFSFVMSSAIEIMRKGQSMIFTDPKGELYKNTAALAEKNGYDVYLLNFISMMNSMRFNVFDYIENEIDIRVIVKVILENTDTGDDESGSGGDPFWERADTSLLQALILYFWYYVDEPTLPKVFDFLVEKGNREIEDIFKILPESDPCKKAFSIYLKAPSNLEGNIVLGLASRLDIMIMSEVRSMLSKSDFDLRDLKRKKVVLYLLIPDGHDAYKFVVNLFITMLGIKLTEFHDKNDHKPEIESREVYFFLDEFANIGAIPNFKKWLATFRSRRVNLIPIVQDFVQLQEMYGIGFSSIVGNCDTKISLGVGEMETADYVSKMLGTFTVKEQMKVKEAGLTRMMDVKQVTVKETERNLMNPDELMRMHEDEVIVFRKTLKPARLYKVPVSAYKNEFKYMRNNVRNPYTYVNPMMKNSLNEKKDVVVDGDTIVL